VVGAAIARNAWPSRIGRDGTVYANTADGIWAFELTQRAVDIARRLGVPAIRFAPGPLAGAPEEAAAPSAPTPSQEQMGEAAAIASAIESEKLRETVQKVVSLGLARSASDRAV
jgi:sugar phosphate isomerase/epimerase